MFGESVSPVGFIHAGSYEEAWTELLRLKSQADTEAAATVYKIVPSPYEGFDVIAIDPELYEDMLVDRYAGEGPRVFLGSVADLSRYLP